MTTILNRDAIVAAGAMEWTAALSDVVEVLRLIRAGDALMVAESVLSLGSDPRHKAYALPAKVGGRFAAAGVKWTVHRPPLDASHETISSTTLVEDVARNRPLGQVESASLTRVRTAAATAAVLAALHPGARRVAVLGAGAIALAHIDMLRALFPDVAQIAVWNRTAERLPEPRALVVHAPTVGAAVDGADVVLACTASTTPILDASAATPGRLICQIGYDEATFDLIDACSEAVVVDGWGDYAERSAKSIFRMYRAGRFSAGDVAADLGDVVHGGWRPAPHRPMYFSSFGLNVFDIAMAARLLRQATGAGLSDEGSER